MFQVRSLKTDSHVWKSSLNIWECIGQTGLRPKCLCLVTKQFILFPANTFSTWFNSAQFIITNNKNFCECIYTGSKCQPHCCPQGQTHWTSVLKTLQRSWPCGYNPASLPETSSTSGCKPGPFQACSHLRCRPQPWKVHVQQLFSFLFFVLYILIYRQQLDTHRKKTTNCWGTRSYYSLWCEWQGIIDGSGWFRLIESKS